MKNKKIGLLLLLPLLISCGGYSFENSSYEAGGIDTFARDSDMVIDGKANETNYDNSETFEIYEPEYQITMKTKVYTGKNGWYFYNELNDTTVMHSKSKQLYQNDGIELHICVNPSETLEIENIQRKNKILNTMLQIRIGANGNYQTWVGNGLEGSYEWTMYYRPCQVAVNIDGEANITDGAKGYSVEVYVPYEAFGLTSAPEQISIMPAFNNTTSNLDTTRKWFTKKGMAHNFPSSWLWVNKDNSFVYDGKEIISDRKLTADENEVVYQEQNKKEIYEVDENNTNEELRGYFKSYYDEKGVYVLAKVYDKIYSRNNDSIWDNDGIEIMIDTKPNGSDNCYKTGMYRFAFDVDAGIQSDIYLDNCNISVPYMMKTDNAVKVNKIELLGEYGYQYEYTYELFIPFESMKLTYFTVRTLKMNFAIKTPGEKAYIKDRKDGFGVMECQDWLWIDRHYPLNAIEFFTVTEEGLI